MHNPTIGSYPLNVQIYEKIYNPHTTNQKYFSPFSQKQSLPATSLRFLLRRSPVPLPPPSIHSSSPPLHRTIAPPPLHPRIRVV